MSLEWMAKLLKVIYRNNFIVDYFNNLTLEEQFQLCINSGWSVDNLSREIIKLIEEEYYEYNYGN